MTTGKLDKAVAIFKLNVAMYPESSNTHDSLAEAQAESGERRAPSPTTGSRWSSIAIMPTPQNG